MGILSDYKQLVDPKKNEKFAGTTKVLNGLLAEVAKHIPTEADWKDPNKAAELALAFTPMGAAGTISKLTEAQIQKYIANISHFTTSKNFKGHNIYRNPLDHAELYSGDWANPNLAMNVSMAGNSAGQGGFHDKLMGFILKEGNFEPQSIVRRDIIEPNTLKQIVEGVLLEETFLGHSSKRIAETFGGKLGPLVIQPTPYSSEPLRNAVREGVDPQNIEEVIRHAKSNSKFWGRNGLNDIFSSVDLHAPISYTNPGGLLGVINK